MTINNLLLRFSRFINVAPKNLEKRRHAEYFGIFLSCVSGVFANLILLPLFAIESVHILTLFSVIGIVNWVTAGYFARQGKFSHAVYIGMLEMMIHVPLIVWVIGTDYGAQMILWAAIAMATLNTSRKPWLTSLVGILVVVQLVLIYAIFPTQTNIQPYQGHENLIFVLMNAMTAAPLMFVLFRLKAIQIKQSKRLTKQIYNDELTGLHNRHFVYELLDYELEMMKKSRSPFCLCFADVDNFKTVNDTHGHLVGDEVLIGIADVLRDNLRKSDVVSRWGGEEFVIILPRCDIQQAPLAIEKVKQALSEQTLSSKSLAITMSFGIVKLSNDEPLEQILKRADDLLYVAKNNGRNRIEVETVAANGNI